MVKCFVKICFGMNESASPTIQYLGINNGKIALLKKDPYCYSRDNDSSKHFTI